MIPIPFFKMSGSGNDFILIDNRQGVVPEALLNSIIVGACRRKHGVGADGLILIENPETDQAAFKWRFFNSDGSVAEMCGNGARCAARFAVIQGISENELAFDTLAGRIQAVVGKNSVKVRMPDPTGFETHVSLEIDGTPMTVGVVNTGVPHAVVRVDDVNSVDVVEIGRKIRFHSYFAPAGTNANFVWLSPDGRILIRTYERGVEDETLACGTGNVAAALILAHDAGKASPITLTTRGGTDQTVHFSMIDGKFWNVFLEGEARVIYSGKLWDEAWKA
ncbi:diaminopimelate epimerase [Desulfosarcina sp. OttesenSCG-928-A07]|nr:diaminopimelate epimerase [Desulfosarcina sp. OttesenSCG-928-G17]MDL2328956.1 diaminopimelate epimerase [Desulfosarcina sp. OttesenSCG-928-A07]